MRRALPLLLLCIPCAAAPATRVPVPTNAVARAAEASPGWVARFPAAKGATQLLVVAGVGMDKTTATVSMHERGADGVWRQILSTPGFVGRNGLCADADHREGCGQTPIGVYRFTKAFGIAPDPGCAIPYLQVDENVYWSGDPDRRYNQLVDIRDVPDLALKDSERIVDYGRHYQYCLNIGFNEAGTPGRGSAIFLHCFGPEKPWTGGCVAVPEDVMRRILQRVRADCVVVIDIAERLARSPVESAPLAAEASRDFFEGGAFETWDEASGLPTATAWRWSMPKDPFAAMERSTAEAHTGASSLHLRDDSTAKENQTLGHVVAKDELAKLRGRRVEVSAWAKQVAASGPKVVGIGLWGRTEDGRIISASDWTGTTLPTDWQELRTTLLVPEDAALLLVQIHCAHGWGATGEAFFDDVALRVLPERDEAAAGPPASPEEAFRASFEDQPAVVSNPWPRPTIERGCFWQDGRPVFFLGPWIYPRTHVDWKEGNPDPQGIGHRAYVEAPGRAIFESMGFNASQLSAAWSVPGQALYGLGLPDDWRKADERIGAFFPRFEGQPMVVDFAFGFADALRKAEPVLARELEQQNGGWHQFLPFCPEAPDGLRYYESYLKGGARAALRGGANVLVWELFNEPVYKCMCRGNAARFAARMEKRYGTIRRANAAWQTAFEDFADVARQTEFQQFPRLWPDYMKFMGERYAEVLETCKGFVREVDARPNVYFAEQSSTFTLTDARGAGMDYRLVADALNVLAYEGGVRFGHGAAKADAAEAEAAAFKSTVEHLFNLDFYRAVARGAKPIVNDEHYCTRVEDGKRVPSRKEDIVTSLWTEVFHGSAGSFTYSWDKRSWEWKTLDEARSVVETPSYKSASLLNPWNYPPEALDGFAQFRDELEPLRDAVLPMPRTTPASVAVFFSYPTLRMLDIDKLDFRARMLRWYGAVLGAHYPLRIVFEEDLIAGLPDDVKALVVPAARYATPESAAAVGRFAARGGTVVADADAFLRDERGDPLPSPAPDIVRLDADSPDSVPALLDALAASGARRDAVLERAGDPATGLCDIQVIDRGDLKLLLLVDLGAREPAAGLLKWNVPEGRYRLSDAATGRAIPNGDSEIWTAADLARGIPVAINPQERLLLRLDAER